MSKTPRDWPLTAKQREKYSHSLKLLYGRAEQGTEKITPSRASAEATEPDRWKQQTLDVPRGTLKPLKSQCLKEWREQEACFQWTQELPALRGFVMSLGNEQKRGVVRAAVAKRMGLLPGASDLFVARPIGIYHGLWLEMKQNRHYSPSEKRSATWLRQEAFQQRMRSVGFAACFAFGADHGIRIIRHYLNNGIMEAMCQTSPVIPPDRVVE